MPYVSYHIPSNTFPFTAECYVLLEALEARNWNVPDIVVEFGVGQRRGERVITGVTGDDFAIRFASNGEVSRIAMPRQELQIFWDTLFVRYLYCTGNWDREKCSFIREDHKSYGSEAEQLISFESGCYCSNTQKATFSSLAPLVGYLTNNPKLSLGVSHRHDGVVDQLLIRSEDVKQDRDGTKTALKTHEIAADFAAWLAKVLLPRITSYPEAASKVNVFDEERAPFPAFFGPLFHMAHEQDLMRLAPTFLNPLSMGLSVGRNLKWRVVYRPTDLPRAKVVEFCRYASTVCHDGEGPADDFPVDKRWPYALRITPNRADGVYVVDQNVYDYVIAQGGDSAAARKALSYTAVRIDNYRCAFGNPLFMIVRDLDPDEVVFASGPWPEYREYLRITEVDAHAKAYFRDLLYHMQHNGHLAVAEQLAHYLLDIPEIRRIAQVRWWQSKATKRGLMRGYILRVAKAMQGVAQEGFLK